MKNYKGFDYEVAVQKLQHDLGYSGFGIVYAPSPTGMQARGVWPKAPSQSKKEAMRVISQEVEEYIDGSPQ